ncbi:MAG TPA: mannose-6-phosphate isomerase, class I, partial [Acidobacteriaceae bacterium]|nr:mannose-6-phosphate isomerase, class I [Acidobacteriaceae bacterium]
QPFAELWMGAHPKAPAVAEAGGAVMPLDKWIAKDPQAVLGSAAERLFGGRLPYLFKILDVAKMLSIQAHPTRTQAREGFARENAAGIGLEEDRRNYKDDNHKPEVGVALTDFWMLHGFRPLKEIAAAFEAAPELHAVMPSFAERAAQAGGDAGAGSRLLRELYGIVMTMPQERVDLLLGPMLARLKTSSTPDKDRPDYWAVRAAKDFPLPGGHYDRGIFSIYLLNLVHLRPGEGTFQPAGVLHAYLEGVNVELMANSDNVLRGGLTPKHVDVPELLRILCFESSLPEVLEGEQAVGSAERVYRTAAEEFELSRIALQAGLRHSGQARQGPEILLLLEGSAVLTAPGQRLELSRGSIVLVPFHTRYDLEPAGDAVFFKAAVPGGEAQGSSLR